MNNLANLFNKELQTIDTLNILPPSSSTLSKLGINSDSLKTMKPSLKTHYRTVITWLEKHQVPDNSSNLEKIRGYLESFYHLCQISDWQAALEIIFTKLNTPTHEELHKQLETWSYYQQRLEIYNNLLGKLPIEIEIVLSNCLGDTNFTLGHYSQAYDCYQKTINLLTIDNDNYIEKAFAIRGLGNISCIQGNYQLAETYYQKFLEIAKNIDNQEQIGKSLQNIGNIYQARQQHHKAIQYYELSLSIFAENEYLRGQATSLLSLGKNHLFLKKYDLAINYYLKSHHIYEKIGDIRGKVISNFELGFIFEILGDFQKSKDYYLLSLNLAKEVKELKLERTITNNLANVCYRLGYLKQASNYYERCLREAINPIEEANFNNSLGGIYYYLKKFDEAFIYFQKVLEIIGDESEIRALELKAKAKCNLGLIFYKLGNFATAINCCKEAEKIYKLFSNNRSALGISYVWGNLGICYRELGKHTIAINYLTKAYEIVIELNDSISQAVQLREIAITYKKNGQLDKAMKFLEQSKFILMKNPFPPEELETFEQLSQLYEELGDKAQAYQYRFLQKDLSLIIEKE